MKLVSYVSIDNNINCDKYVLVFNIFVTMNAYIKYFMQSFVKFLFSSDSEIMCAKDL